MHYFSLSQVCKSSEKYKHHKHRPRPPLTLVQPPARQPAPHHRPCYEQPCMRQLVEANDPCLPARRGGGRFSATCERHRAHCRGRLFLSVAPSRRGQHVRQWLGALTATQPPLHGTEILTEQPSYRTTEKYWEAGRTCPAHIE